MADSVDIRVNAIGSETLGEMQNEVKRLRQELKSLIPGTEKFLELSKQRADIQNRINAANKQGWSEDAKLRDSYFRTGEEIRRRSLPALSSFGNIIQDSTQFTNGFSQGMRAVGNNIDMMTQQIIYLNAQSGSFKNTLMGMISALKGPAGMLIAVSVVTTALTVFTQGLSKAAKKARELVAELSIYDRVAKQIDTDTKKRKTTQEDLNEFLIQEQGILAGIAAHYKNGVIWEIIAGRGKSVDELRLELIDIRKHINDLIPGSDEFNQPLPKPPTDTHLPFFLRSSLGTDLGIARKGPSLRPTVDVSAAREAMKAVKESDPLSKQIAQTLVSGARTFAHTLVMGLLEGRNVAQSLAATLLEALVNIGITAAFSSFGIPVPGVGSAVSGGAPSLAAQKSYGGGTMGGMVGKIKIENSKDLYLYMKAQGTTVSRTSYG